MAGGIWTGNPQWGEVDDEYFLLAWGCWSSALDFVLTSPLLLRHLLCATPWIKRSLSLMLPVCCNMRVKTNTYRWLTCHKSSKGAHVLENTWYFEEVRKELEEGWSPQMESSKLCWRGSCIMWPWKTEVRDKSEKSYFFWPQKKCQILICTEKEKNLHYLARECATKPIHKAVV